MGGTRGGIGVVIAPTGIERKNFFFFFFFDKRRQNLSLVYIDVIKVIPGGGQTGALMGVGGLKQQIAPRSRQESKVKTKAWLQKAI